MRVHERRSEVLWRSTSVGPVLLAPTMAAPTILGGAAGAVWELLDAPMDHGALVAAATAVVGEVALVGEAIDELIAHDLVATCTRT